MDREAMEQTLVLIKPDALKNSVTGFLLSQLSEFHTGSQFAGVKIVNVNRTLAEQHYIEHRERPFYRPLVDYIMGCAHYPNRTGMRRVIAIVYRGPGVIQKIRTAVGPTNPHVAREESPGCIRALGTVVPIKDEQGQVISERMDNLIHASATREDAEREIKLWFRPSDIPPLMRGYPTDVCQEYYYLKGGDLVDVYEPGSFCVLAPGHVVWTSDLEILRSRGQDESAASQVDGVIAKYLINWSAEETGRVCAS